MRKILESDLGTTNRCYDEKGSTVRTTGLPVLSDKHIRVATIVLCEAFTLFTLLRLIYNRNFDHILICAATIVCVIAPTIIEHLLSFKINNIIGYVLIHLYAIFPLLGECYDLYYVTSWWDKMVHTCSGVVFALLGLYLIKRLSGSKANIITCAVFALCFSVTISVFWEFAEFASDRIFGTDTQNDTVITDVTTYFLGDEPGEAGTIKDIHEVIIDGQALPFEGYLDIGLIDTMMDMQVETVGALITVILYLVYKGKSRKRCI